MIMWSSLCLWPVNHASRESSTRKRSVHEVHITLHKEFPIQPTSKQLHVCYCLFLSAHDTRPATSLTPRSQQQGTPRHDSASARKSLQPTKAHEHASNSRAHLGTSQSDGPDEPREWSALWQLGDDRCPSA